MDLILRVTNGMRGFFSSVLGSSLAILRTGMSILLRKIVKVVKIPMTKLLKFIIMTTKMLQLSWTMNMLQKKRTCSDQLLEATLTIHL